MAEVRKYNAGDVSIVVGTRRLTGLAESSFVKVTRDEDSFTKKVGATGEVTRSRTNNRTGKIEIKLEQASPDNAFLQSLVNNDERTGGGIVPTTVEDGSGSSLAFSQQSWVMKPADDDKSRDSSERTWIMDCADLELSGGGN